MKLSTKEKNNKSPKHLSEVEADKRDKSNEAREDGLKKIYRNFKY